jgi:hypothetical protein
VPRGQPAEGTATPRKPNEGGEGQSVEKPDNPRLLQRLRVESSAAKPLAQDVRRELRLLRAEMAERNAEAEEVRRQLQQLRSQLSPDAVRSVKDSVGGTPGEAPFDKLVERGRAALAERDYEVAVRDLTRAAVLEPADPDVQALLQAARAGLDKVNREVPDALERAKVALLDGDVEQAKNILGVLLLVAPKDRRVREAVGHLQARLAKGDPASGGESRWLTAEEIAALNNRLPPPPTSWRLGEINPEITGRAIAYENLYRMTADQQSARNRSVGGEHTAALQGETDRAWRAGREHDAATAEENTRSRTAWDAGREGLIEESGRGAGAGREAQVAWQAQDARLTQFGRQLEAAWRQQSDRGYSVATEQMLGLLQQNGRVGEAVRQHDVLARQQGERMAGAAGDAAAARVEQRDRVVRAERENNAGLRLLVERAQEIGRQLTTGARVQDERGAVLRGDERQGRNEVNERFRAGARGGRDNIAGQGQRFDGGHGQGMDERVRAAVRDRQLTGDELADRLMANVREQRSGVETRHSGEVQSRAETETPAPPPPQAEDSAEKQKERDEAERALAERNRKAREAAELKRLQDESDQRRRDAEELKKLIQGRETREREATELKLLQAEKERFEHLGVGLKGVPEYPKKK